MEKDINPWDVWDSQIDEYDNATSDLIDLYLVTDWRDIWLTDLCMGVSKHGG